MDLNTPVTELIQQRTSCRSYQGETLPDEARHTLENFIAALPSGPFGSPNRFKLTAADEADPAALRGLGTYGAIRSPAAFIIGTSQPGLHSLEDFGYQMESIVLKAADLGLGTCWLGGNFTRSSFSSRISASEAEIIPAVVSLGKPLKDRTMIDLAFRQGAGSDRRYPWEALFFAGAFGAPLSREAAGEYALPLEMLRRGPSASNKQPWRVIQSGNAFHFYIQRTPNYPGKLVVRLLGVADMQRIDIGIAMCHFELTARQAGLTGQWKMQEPSIEKPDTRTEYSASWVCG